MTTLSAKITLVKRDRFYKFTRKEVVSQCFVCKLQKCRCSLTLSHPILLGKPLSTPNIFSPSYNFSQDSSHYLTLSQHFRNIYFCLHPVRLVQFHFSLSENFRFFPNNSTLVVMLNSKSTRLNILPCRTVETMKLLNIIILNK